MPSLAVTAAFFAAIFVISVVLVRVMLTRVRIMDHPNWRSSHQVPVPRSGGIAIVAAYLAGLLCCLAVLPSPEPWLMPLTAAVVFLAGVSMLDDLRDLGFKTKLLVQIVCAGIVVWGGLAVIVPSGEGGSLDRVSPIIVSVVAVAWLTGFTNSFNFMDGLDGLAGGCGAIAALFLCLIAGMAGMPAISQVGGIIVAATLGFLLFNFPPARIFMGDTGSQTLGFSLAALGIFLGEGGGDGRPWLFFVVPVLTFHFLWDTGLTMARRVSRKVNIFQAHREHLYQLLNRMGWSHRRVTLTHYAMAVVQGGLAMILAQAETWSGLLVFLPLVLIQVVYTQRILSRARQAGLI